MAARAFNSIKLPKILINPAPFPPLSIVFSRSRFPSCDGPLLSDEDGASLVVSLFIDPSAEFSSVAEPPVVDSASL